MEEKNIFTEDIKIPDIVLKKADVAFAAIRKEESAAISTEYMDMTPKTRKRLFKSGWLLAACIALIALCGATVFAAINHFWSDGMNQMLTAEETQVQELEENGMAVFPDNSQAVTADGITIAPIEVVSDGNVAYLAFSVTGLDALADPDTEIAFGSWHMEMEPEGMISSAIGQFYDTPITDADGNAAREFTVMIYGRGQESPLLNKSLQLELSDLSIIAGKADLGRTLAAGPWTFDLSFPSAAKESVYEIHQELTDSVYTVDSVTITPISIQLDYSVTGEPEIWQEDNSIPLVVAVKMKDGTVIHTEDESRRVMIDNFERTFDTADDGSCIASGKVCLSQVIDPEEVAQITLQEYSEAIAWGDVPDEIVAQEYGGEIPFERVMPGEEQYWEVEIQ